MLDLKQGRDRPEKIHGTGKPGTGEVEKLPKSHSKGDKKNETKKIQKKSE
jgi:hypothetical protein